MDKYHLAQINIAHAQNKMTSEEMKGFVDRLDEINSLADKSEGFILFWYSRGRTCMG